ncbi:MAG: FtsX-like permease family protein [Deltaproteobacteria bacterium]|nr:FtsX-like permease family protein [Deltaproteobacteria bacterium]
MSNTVAWLAGRELLRSRGFLVSFVLSLSLGLIGFLALDSFKHSMQSYLEQRSQTLLGGDIQLYSLRQLAPSDDSALSKFLTDNSHGHIEVRREIQLVSMVATASGDSRLVDIRAVDGKFPFYGSLTLDPSRDGATLSGPVAWVYPELLQQLNIKRGDTLKIGSQTFHVTHSVAQDPTLSGLGFRIAPRAYIDIAMMESTGLLATGSRLWYVWILKLPPELDLNVVANDLRRVMSADVKVDTHYESSRDSGRFLQYLNDYLGLAALVATFFAGVTCAYLFRSYLSKKRRDMAVLLSMGLGVGATQMVYLVQLVIVATLAAVISLVAAQIFLPLLPRVLAGLVPQELASSGFQLIANPRSWLLAAVWAIGGSVVIALPTLVQLRRVKPAQLFQDAAYEGNEGRGRRFGLSALWWLPSLVLFWAVATIQANSPKVGSLFVIGFLASALILSGLGQLGLVLLARLSQSRWLAWDLGVLSMTRHRLATLVSFVSLALGTLLLILIPQLRTGIAGELVRPSRDTLPALFLFDIQPEQLQPLRDIVQREGGALGLVSPLIRARLELINGQQPVEQKVSTTRTQVFTSREREETERARSRLYNLSYRSSLSPSEEITAGLPFPADTPTDLPFVSVEEQFAKRVGIHLGDVLSFDVQGVRVDGKVRNFRKVRWTSFQPNFFVQFQPGVLDDAPQTLIASVTSAPDKTTMQSAIVKLLPNISVIDIGATVTRILALVTQMSYALNVMAALAIMAGLGVIFAMAQDRARQKQRDMALLKAIGLSFADLRWSLMLEFGLLGLGAGLLGSLTSLGLSWGTAKLLFDQIWAADFITIVAATLVLPLLTCATGLLASRRPLKEPAVSLLGEV